MNPLNPVILCVDDEEANLKLLEKLLVPRGYVVVCAASGKDALLKIKSQAIDLVLLDIIMPGMDGFEVCRQIKEDQKLRNIPVIMITASIVKQDRILGIEAGAEEFLLKPFDLAEVLARIKMLLKMKKLDDERKLAELQKEVAIAALQKSHDELDRRVQERTAELTQANEVQRNEHTMLARTEGIANIGSWEWDIATDTVIWSDELFRIFQRNPREGAPSFAEHPAFYHPDDMARLRQAVEAAVADGTPYELELRAIRKDGETRFCVARGVVDMERGGRPIRLFGSLQDISERKQIEEALRESAAFLNATGQIAKVGSWELDTANLCLNWTEETYRIHELPPGYKLTLEEAINYYYPDERQKLSDSIQRALKYGETYDMELRFISAKGKHLWTRSICFPQTVDGKIVKLTGTFQDITERKQAEEALKESENKYRLLADNIHDVIFVLDMNLKYTYISPSVKILRGYEHNELLNKPTTETLTPPSLDLAVRTLFEIMELEKSENREINVTRTLELEMKRKDGTTVWTEVKFSLIRDEDQQPVGIMGVTRDITERRKAEENLLLTLENLRKSFSTTVQVMVSAVEMKDPYTAGHQLRVAHLACAIATEMGFAPEKIDGIRMAGSIHDIGKLSIPSEILSKPTKLTKIEFSLIKEHSQSGYEMLRNVESPWPLAQIVYQHHERMDGSGYPRNLKGDEILMDARIMAVADVVEAMASHRPYRSALGIDVALEEIEKNKGTLYDDAVADACMRLFREKDYQLIA